MAAIWEIAIKHSPGRGDMPVSSQGTLHCLRESGYQYLDIKPQHAAGVEDLPAHHADPTDRLLAAQALIEPMRLMTHDLTLVR